MRANIRVASLRNLVGGWILVAGIAFPSPAIAGAESPILDVAAQALDRDDFATARQQLRPLLASARAAGDARTESDCLFYLGLADQKEASLVQGTEQARLFSEARDLYETSLKHKRSLGMPLGPALNNLARVYVEARTEEGDAEADRLFGEAIGLADSYRWVYAMNRAELSERRGDWETAAKSYRIMVEDRPEEIGAHQRLLEIYSQHDLTELLSYLRSLVGAGLVKRAQEAALDFLLATETPPEKKPDLLAVTATTLAREPYAPDKYSETTAARKLAALRKDPMVGMGIRELEQLHNKPEGSCCAWWTASGDMRKAAFLELLFSLGRRSFDARMNHRAGIYFDKFSDSGGFEHPNPTTLLALADFYFNTDRIESLDRIGRLSGELRIPVLPWQGSLDEQYALHASLGQMYGILGRWGNSSSPTSAAYQLGKAQQLAQLSSENLIWPQGRTPALEYLATESEHGKDLERSLAFTPREVPDTRRSDWSISAELLSVEDPYFQEGIVVTDANYLEPRRPRFLGELTLPKLPSDALRSLASGKRLTAQIRVESSGRAVVAGINAPWLPTLVQELVRKQLERGPWSPALDSRGSREAFQVFVSFHWKK